jgi:hypothetical protein
MAKFIYAKDYQIYLENDKFARPVAIITAPQLYSFLDLIDMIKIYANYGDKYEWDFYIIEKGLKLLSKYSKNEFDDIKLGKLWVVEPSIDCYYGSIKFDIGKRRTIKYHKPYPEIYYGEKFPSENELEKGKPFEKDKKVYTKEELAVFNEKFKEYFNTKYKISNEIDTENSDPGNPYNKLVKK